MRRLSLSYSVVTEALSEGVDGVPLTVGCAGHAHNPLAWEAALAATDLVVADDQVDAAGGDFV
ncbi:MAG TPA: hypothetical protein EYP98_05015 [Planctomycetes bacterium]|nr:hypothetical protein [Planctomycetota bacterium]